ncbi:MAG: hypothetical protein JO049_22915, partial [Hyphomicrobiales bacterium]|nr:hypothetical protein [Hyphomicrobiales bacterium]
MRGRARRVSRFLQKNRKIQEKTAMRFQQGQSGNPAGRPRGALNRATVLAQELLSARVERIAGKLIELAEGGDMRAIRVCMERLMPAIKHQPIAVELPPIENATDSVKAVASIAAAVAAGELTATEAAELAKGNLEQYSLSAISALAERLSERLQRLCRGEVGPRSGTVLTPGRRPRGPLHDATRSPPVSALKRVQLP